MSEAINEDHEPNSSDAPVDGPFFACLGWLVLFGAPIFFLYWGLTASNACERCAGFGLASPWILIPIVAVVRRRMDRRRGWAISRDRFAPYPSYLEVVDGAWQVLEVREWHDGTLDSPSGAEWDDATPEWAQGRREVILGRMNLMDTTCCIGVRIAEDVGACPRCSMIQVVRKWYPTPDHTELRETPIASKQRRCKGCNHRWLA